MTFEKLPSKEFRFILKSGDIINGKFGMWAANRFCLKKNLSITEYINKFSDTDKMTFDHICTLLLASVEYYHRKNKLSGPFTYTDIDACEWIEEFGGVASEDFVALLNYFASDLEPEKKNQEQETTES